jgi:hypothetical protein
VNDALRRRLRALETTRGPRRGGVVLALVDESFEDAALRANRGAVIVMPAAMNADVWERETVGQQRRLVARAAAVVATSKDAVP